MVTGPARSSGASLPEVIVALLLGLVVVQLGLSSLAELRATHGDLVARADALVALRVGRHALRHELRYGLEGRDWAVDEDSLALRAFRGTALVCENDTTSAEVVVSFRGERSPDPSKDSVLLITSAGLVAVRALVGVGAAAAPCTWGPGDSRRWRLDQAAPPETVLARLFERGAYHLSGAAIRYRRGASGRQPLTPEVLAPTTRWDLTSSRLGISLDPAAGSALGWTGFLAWLAPE